MQARSQEGTESEPEPGTSSSRSVSLRAAIGDPDPVPGDLQCWRPALHG